MPNRRKFSHVGTTYSLTALLSLTLATTISSTAEASPLRRTPIVKAVERAAPAVVNIHGQKLVNSEGLPTADATKRVNGMGTGVVIDERGYIITNYHVIEGVRRIQVTTGDERTYVARLIARDPHTDLAIIKIKPTEPLPLLPVGTSSDLMTGEPVIAVGNAYGYHHTVTRGIISALNRTVEVTDTQEYFDLIQTDASINPGNSGGPLLNVDGQMIGINVAVRVGAQGIGFAIPVDKAMEVAAKLLKTERIRNRQTSYGLQGVSRMVDGEVRFVAKKVAADGPAARAGIRPGDTIKRMGRIEVARELDVERALLGLEPGKELSVVVQRGDIASSAQVVLAPGRRKPSRSVENDIWNVWGVRLAPVPSQALHNSDGHYKGGLRVAELRQDGLAARQGIVRGDILVGVHRWETVSFEDLDYILNRSPLDDTEPVRFYVVRGLITHEGKLPLIR